MSSISSMKTDVIRKGDRVLIETQLRFVRCGYELDSQAATEKVLEIASPQIRALIEALGLAQRYVVNFGDDEETPVWDHYGHDERLMRKIAKAAGYGLIDKARDHEAERKIFIEPLGALNYLPPNKFTVKCVKFVQTGTFKPGRRGHMDMYGEWDEYPARLEDSITHKVCLIDNYDMDLSFGKGPTFKDGVWVLAEHLRKVES